MMGMPITVEVVDATADTALFEEVFAYFQYVDDTFSTYKAESEISRLNRKELAPEEASPDVQRVFALAEEMRRKTNGYFDIQRDGICDPARGCWRDPSGLVKGWAIFNAADILYQKGLRNFYVEAGGDIQAAGKNSRGQPWRVGIRNPFNRNEIVKAVAVSERGVATSGTYVRGQHIYNPKDPHAPIPSILSLTVIGPDIYHADCYATAAFAMGRDGIGFIAGLDGYEGYMIDQERRATFTPGFARYVLHA